MGKEQSLPLAYAASSSSSSCLEPRVQEKRRHPHQTLLRAAVSSMPAPLLPPSSSSSGRPAPHLQLLPKALHGAGLYTIRCSFPLPSKNQLALLPANLPVPQAKSKGAASVAPRAVGLAFNGNSWPGRGGQRLGTLLLGQARPGQGLLLLAFLFHKMSR